MWFFLRRRDSGSIRNRLAGLFLFANGLPLMVLAFLGYDFLQNKREALVNDAQLRSERLLTQFDSRLPVRLQQLVHQLEAKLAAFHDSRVGSSPVLLSLIKSPLLS